MPKHPASIGVAVAVFAFAGCGAASQPAKTVTVAAKQPNKSQPSEKKSLLTTVEGQIKLEMEKTILANDGKVRATTARCSIVSGDEYKCSSSATGDFGDYCERTAATQVGNVNRTGWKTRFGGNSEVPCPR